MNAPNTLVNFGALFGVWSPIETAPRDGTTILAHYPDKIGYVARQDIVPVYWFSWGGGVWENLTSGGKLGNQPTHWMPLPPLPNTPVRDAAKGSAQTP